MSLPFTEVSDVSFVRAALQDIGLAEVEASRKSLGVHDGDASGVVVEREHAIDCRRLVDGPHRRVEDRVAVDATRPSSARNSQEEGFGAVILYN